MSRQTEKITALYERLSRDDEAAGDSTSIVKHIAQYHHAEIKLHSGNGRGTIIEILFAIGEM